MKRDIVDFVAMCGNCQQVKYEHQWPDEAKVLVAQSRPKNYADRKVQELKFAIGDQVQLKVSPMKCVMRFGKRGKLSTRYIDPFEILDCIGDVASRLALPLGLAGVHPVFHVSILKKYPADGTYIGTDLLRDSFDKVKLFQEGLLTAQTGQKSCAGQKRIRELANELALPPGLLGVHSIFHISMLNKYHSDGSYVIRWDSVMLEQILSYEEESIAILNRQIRKLRSKEITSVKVQWRGRSMDEATWETQLDMTTEISSTF
ncbi:uncharacterized protein LOC132613023 [Lycium barbarum]|uniref:uncharacterized protein LOC132613023 n=1 Tax=Lycium barbarum TaxID=112863 RepID=UPI00293F79A3|nr:uncharacterized protein LOC132613023 [Lycium barbarum]